MDDAAGLRLLDAGPWTREESRADAGGLRLECGRGISASLCAVPYLHKLARALPIARTITHIRRAHSAGRGQRTLGLITGEWQHPDVCPVPVLLML